MLQLKYELMLLLWMASFGHYLAFCMVLYSGLLEIYSKLLEGFNNACYFNWKQFTVEDIKGYLGISS